MPTPQKRKIKEKRNEQRANKDGKKKGNYENSMHLYNIIFICDYMNKENRYVLMRKFCVKWKNFHYTFKT